MTFGLRLAIQAGHGDEAHRNALALRLELDGVEDVRVVLRLGDKDLANGASLGPQKLEDRVATLDLIASDPVTVARLVTRRPPLGPTLRSFGTVGTLGPARRRGTRTHESLLNRTMALASDSLTATDRAQSLRGCGLHETRRAGDA